MRMVEAGLGRNYGRAMAMHGPRVDFAALARAQGAHGFVAETLADLRAALAHPPVGGPCVIDVHVDPTAAFPVNARVAEISNFTAR
jgi:thiamine pyrophosphate-dependent acetolactate synthase large subunit-like protein